MKLLLTFSVTPFPFTNRTNTSHSTRHRWPPPAARLPFGGIHMAAWGLRLQGKLHSLVAETNDWEAALRPLPLSLIGSCPGQRWFLPGNLCDSECSGIQPAPTAPLTHTSPPGLFWLELLPSSPTQLPIKYVIRGGCLTEKALMARGLNPLTCACQFSPHIAFTD